METPDNNEEKEKKPYEFKKTNRAPINVGKQEDKKGDLNEVIKNVLTDAGLSVLGGGLTSAILGRFSLPLGVIITGYGHYKKNNALRVLGIGIMASSSMANRIQNDPKASAIEDISKRVKAFADELKAKLGLDLLSMQKAAKQEATTSLNGINNAVVANTSITRAPTSETTAPEASLFEGLNDETIKQQPVEAAEEQSTEPLHTELDEELDRLASMKRLL